MRILHENPEFHGAKLHFLQFLCIAERVTVHGTAFFSRAVNSNDSSTGITRNEDGAGRTACHTKKDTELRQNLHI